MISKSVLLKPSILTGMVETFTSLGALETERKLELGDMERPVGGVEKRLYSETPMSLLLDDHGGSDI